MCVVCLIRYIHVAMLQQNSAVLGIPGRQSPMRHKAAYLGCCHGVCVCSSCTAAFVQWSFLKIVQMALSYNPGYIHTHRHPHAARVLIQGASGTSARACAGSCACAWWCCNLNENKTKRIARSRQLNSPGFLAVCCLLLLLDK